MLTPTDMHYVVGLLVKLYHEENVDIELGAMIWDEAAEKSRDVDIIVRTGLDETTVIRAYEVKHYADPLDVTDVEQLCQKFSDMPTVSRKAIVSANGYSAAAIKKAAKHEVDLYHLAPWIGYDQEVSNLIFLKEDFQFAETVKGWIEPYDTYIDLGEFNGKLEGVDLNALPVCDKDGNARPNNPIARNLADWVADQVLQDCAEYVFDDSSDSSETRVLDISRPVKLDVTQYLKYKEQVMEVYEFRVVGKASFTVNRRPPEFRVLCKIGDPQPYIGCVLVLLHNQTLFGITTQRDKVLEMFQVPISDRLKNKIYKQRI